MKLQVSSIPILISYINETEPGHCFTKTRRLERQLGSQSDASQLAAERVRVSFSNKLGWPRVCGQEARVHIKMQLWKAAKSGGWSRVPSEQEEYQSLELAGGQDLHNGGPARANEKHTQKSTQTSIYMGLYELKKEKKH